jgi:hypothetical protein
MALQTGEFAPTPTHRITARLLLPLLPCIAGCATVPLQQTGSLSSYERLQPDDGLFTKARVSVDKGAVLAARMVRIVPTTFSAAAATAKLSVTDRKLVANAVDRSVCIGLSDRFRIVLPPQMADLTVHVSIASIVPTDEIAAATSKVLDIGQSVVTSVGVVETSIPIPSVRVPIGLGGIALEAEAVDPAGSQRAAMLWARGANSFTGNTRVSPVGDAYELASSFGGDFSELLVTGVSPFSSKLPSLPSMHSVKSMFGGAPRESACDAFGRMGVTDLLAGSLGLPPGWTDKGGQEDQQTYATRLPP